MPSTAAASTAMVSSTFMTSTSRLFLMPSTATASTAMVSSTFMTSTSRLFLMPSIAMVSSAMMTSTSMVPTGNRWASSSLILSLGMMSSMFPHLLQLALFRLIALPRQINIKFVPPKPNPNQRIIWVQVQSSMRNHFSHVTSLDPHVFVPLDHCADLSCAPSLLC